MGNVPVKKTRRARRRRSTTALDRYVPQIGMPPLVESNGPDALETGHKLWRRRWVIITGIILGGAAAALISWSMPTLYTSEARILVGVQGPRVPNIETILADISADAERVQDEGFVLQSRALAKQVIERLNLLATRDFDPEFNPPPLWARSMDPFDYLPQSYSPLQYLPTWLTGRLDKASGNAASVPGIGPDTAREFARWICFSHASTYPHWDGPMSSVSKPRQ